MTRPQAPTRLENEPAAAQDGWLHDDKGVGPSSLPIAKSSSSATGAPMPIVSLNASADEEMASNANGHASVPFENLFTLPWALRLQPLPHTSFLIRPLESGASSEASSILDERADEDGAYRSDGGSEPSNYRAGMHQLERVDSSVPPHSLRTISTLLDKTRCLDAVPTWARLFELLNSADDDPHFANLCAFFDARFDRAGKLVRKNTDTEASPVRTGPGMFRMRSGSDVDSATMGRSPSVRSESRTRFRRPSQSKPRQASSRQQQSLSSPIAADDQTGTNAMNAANLLFRKRAVSQHHRHDEGSEGLDGTTNEIAGTANRAAPPLRAPEITLRTRDSDEARTTRFTVRLDLHAVNLAPPPPTPPIAPQSQKMRPQQQAASSGLLARSPSRRTAPGSDANRLHRVLSNGSSSDHSMSDGISLRPVMSPDSFQSRHPSEHDGSNGHDQTAAGPNVRPEKHPRTWTISTTDSVPRSFDEMRHGADSNTNGDGTGTPDDNEKVVSSGLSQRRRTFSKLGSFSKADQKRRPSMIQRLIDFRGFRNRSATSTSSAPDFTDDEHKSNGSSLEPSRYTPATSTAGASEAASNGQAPVSAPSSGPPAVMFMGRRGSRTEASETSNDEAIDTGEDDGSVGSSHAHFNSRRRSSAGMLQAFRPAPELGPVHEGAVYTVTSSDEGHGARSASREKQETQKGTPVRFRDGGDFLALLRSAANTTLTLHQSDDSALNGESPEFASSYGAMGEMMQSPIAETMPGAEEQIAKAQTDVLLAPFKAGGSAAWWLSGSADPLPISIACAWSQALGWNGIMDLCYGRGSKSVADGMFQSLGKAAHLDTLQQQDKQRVESWAQNIPGGDTTLVSEGPASATGPAFATNNDKYNASMNDTASDAVAPSESASMQGQEGDSQEDKKSDGPVAALSKLITSKLRTKSTDTGTEGDARATERGTSLFDSGAHHDDSDKKRTWKDWAELMKSIARWVQAYEQCRIRNGLAGEIGTGETPRPIDETTSLAYRPDSSFLDPATDRSKACYMTRMSYKVPACVVKDATNRQHGFRRRDGIPEGLPLGANGEEIGDYRWSNKRLTKGQFATSATLAALSLSHITGQLAFTDWPHSSAWELDYLEMCVFKSPIVARRFPPSGERIVTSSQHFVVTPGDEAAARRAMPCPYPDQFGMWDAQAWLRWLGELRGGHVVVPAVSWQAWWTLIAVLNGADGSGRPLDVQLKAEEEPFDALTDPEVVYL